MLMLRAGLIAFNLTLIPLLFSMFNFPLVGHHSAPSLILAAVWCLIVFVVLSLAMRNTNWKANTEERLSQIMRFCQPYAGVFHPTRDDSTETLGRAVLGRVLFVLCSALLGCLEDITLVRTNVINSWLALDTPGLI
jgi:hypothetical protein